MPATKSALEMVMELRQVVAQLPPKVADFVNSMQLLIDEGMDDALDVNTLRQLYAKHVGVRGLPASPPAQQQSFPPFAQMMGELDEGALLINDADRDFIEGLKMLLGMQEQITTSDVVRLQKIYMTFKQNAHLGSTIRG